MRVNQELKGMMKIKSKRVAIKIRLKRGGLRERPNIRQDVLSGKQKDLKSRLN